MTYPQAIAYLDSLIDFERKPLPEQARSWNLDRTRALLAAVGNPHKSLTTIHIAGTKGKGSTAAFIAPILRAAGYRVGLYTSPHLVDFRERIRLDGACIPKRDVTRLVLRLMPHVEHLKKTLPFPPVFSRFTRRSLCCGSQNRRWTSRSSRPASAAASTRPMW